MEKNGSIFIKLGQHLSSMTYLLRKTWQPPEWTSTFVPLQDKCPKSSIKDIDRMLREDMGSTISDLFSEFDEEPIGTGSLTRFALTNIKLFFPEYPMDWLSEEMELSLPVELNFVEEAKNICKVRAHFQHIQNTALVVPRVIWARKRILVLEYLRGFRIDDLSSLDRAGISREEVSASLAHIFNEMIFGQNAPLHCDPHHGNLAVRPNTSRYQPNFDIILYDHGLYRDIPVETRRSYAKLWLAVLDGDEQRMRTYASQVAGITDEQFPLFASAITGRDFIALRQSVSTARSDDEKQHIATAMANGMLPQLVQLLANVPRIILLILKTNDLTRRLDESLQTTNGPERTFLIMAQYCSRTLYEEEREIVRQNGGVFKAYNLIKIAHALLSFYKTKFRLMMYELYLRFSQISHTG
ncbi:hypothetical protein DRE_05047 [Drechslerella stenobrocha 248]|uniref:ABC1 atypical kinase-like domain-containing protein n=1 Tax=Drechslerella stenobrocha 248 TaxID=1043628 RepID=W7I9K1_9PEZI|nr:hypothetical protein DRE_05047 [Drechslerella stenobrocha 248]